MGRLITETPHSEITATLEVLDRLGVSREDMTCLRKASPGRQIEVAQLIKRLVRPLTKSAFEIRDGVLYALVTSSGRTVQELLQARKKTHIIHDDAEYLLSKKIAFEPTTGVTYRVPIIMCSEISGACTTSKLRSEAKRRGYTTLPLEAACLLFSSLSHLDYNQNEIPPLLCMHNPVRNEEDYQMLLCVWTSLNALGLETRYGHADYEWDGERYFAFLDPR